MNADLDDADAPPIVEPVENNSRRGRKGGRRRRPTTTGDSYTASPLLSLIFFLLLPPPPVSSSAVVSMRSAASNVIASARGTGSGGRGGDGLGRGRLGPSSLASFVADAIIRHPSSASSTLPSHPSFVPSCHRLSSSSSSFDVVVMPIHPRAPPPHALYMMATPKKIMARIGRRGANGAGGKVGEDHIRDSSSVTAVDARSPSRRDVVVRDADRTMTTMEGEGRAGGRIGSVAEPAADDAGGRRRPSSSGMTPTDGRERANTGRLRLLPPLHPATEILSRASRQSHHEVKEDMSIANAKRRTQKRGAQTIDLLSQKLCAPLRETVRTYERELRRMHPFEAVVMDLTVRARRKRDGITLDALLAEIHDGRKELLQLSKDWITKIKTSSSTREAYETTEEAKESIGRAFVDLIDVPWTGIMELQRSLRNAPVVRLDCPAVVLVGAPNVGKSSIVRAISSGTPEVNNYPFTTRGVTLGHVRIFWESEGEVASGNVAGVSIPSEKQLIQERLVKGRKDKKKKKKKKTATEEEDEGDDEVNERRDVKSIAIDDDDDGDDGEIPLRHSATSPASSSKEFGGVVSDGKAFPISQLCQIMDSPGVLRRDDGKSRNEMEELTLAAMSHLPTAVMYVMDLSGGAGDKCSSVDDQLILRRELRARFPRRPWIDVVSKVDLGVVDGARERLVSILEAEGGTSSPVAARHFIELSIKDGVGVEELRQEVMRMLGEVRVVLDAMAAIDERSARAV